MNTYYISFVTPGDRPQRLIEVLKSRTTRKSKIKLKIEELFLKKYGFPLSDCRNVELFSKNLK